MLFLLLVASAAAAVPVNTRSSTCSSTLLGPVTGNAAIDSSAYNALTLLIPTVLSNAVSISTHSWELGVLTEALLEVYDPQLTPFGWDGSLGYGAAPAAVLDIAASALGSYDWSGSPGSGNGQLTRYRSGAGAQQVPQPLVDGAGALGDPCSLGPAVWVLASYADSCGDPHGITSADYAWAVGNQYAYLLDGVASDNGTISQREGYFEVWSDMGYMIPPFLAYLGLVRGQTTYLSQAIDQWFLESSSMLDTNVNIWRHVNDWDARLWATGNGCMLAGGMRVIESIIAAGYGSVFAGQIEQAEEILAGVFTALFDRLDANSLMPDYMDQGNATLALGDTAGTAAVISAFYRFYVLRPDLAGGLTGQAAAAFDGVMSFVASDGWLSHEVDPQGTYGWVVYPESSLRSPEGQSFLGLMWAARTAAGI
ncbi:hypothetical protein Q5752_001883 [Cryptotrichosporon argae]